LPSPVFYISGHGFGHASREVEVINTFGARRPDAAIFVRSAVSPELLQRTLRVPYTLLPGRCDTGVVQTSSVAHDDEATMREAIAFYESADARIAEEAARLPPAIDLVVGDIPPIAFEVAGRRGIPSVAIGNFTWDWIYEGYAGLTDRAPWLVPVIQRGYRQATLALELPFAGGFDVFPDVRRIPLVARHASRRPEDTRGHFGLPPGRRAALVSFGGYGMPDLDLAALDCLGSWTIVTTDRSAGRPGPRPAGVVRVDERAFLGTGFRYEDLVAAVDVVVTKPGYGITAECITGDTAMLYTSRGAFREYDLLVREMPRYLRTRFISQPDLFAGRWGEALDALVRQPPAPEHLPADGAAVAAEVMLELLAPGPAEHERRRDVAQDEPS